MERSTILFMGKSTISMVIFHSYVSLPGLPEGMWINPFKYEYHWISMNIYIYIHRHINIDIFSHTLHTSYIFFNCHLPWSHLTGPMGQASQRRRTTKCCADCQAPTKFSTETWRKLSHETNVKAKLGFWYIWYKYR